MNNKQLTRRIELREKALELFEAGADYKEFQENGLQNSWYYSLKNDRKKFEAQLDELKTIIESTPSKVEEETPLNIQKAQSRLNVLRGEIRRYNRVIQKARESEKDALIERYNEIIEERLELERELEKAYEKQTNKVSNTNNKKYNE